MKNAFDFTIRPLGENGWLATIRGNADVTSKALYANAVADTARKQPGVIDSVAGLESVAVRFDPAALQAGAAKTQLEDAFLTTPQTVSETDIETIEIPICYGGEFGPDLSALAKQIKLSENEIISRHSENAYRILAIGFAPGFAYVGPLDPALETARLKTPRQRVAPGSVGVAGGFTCLYPLPSPGGWRLIGRTPLPLFDPSSNSPFKFRPGARIRFRPINAAAFDAFDVTTPTGDGP